MCPSLAEPDWGGFPKRIVFSYKPQANKSFSVQQFFKNAAEVWASSPHLRSKLDFAVWFSSCNCIFWNLPIRNLIDFMKQVANSDKATGQLQQAGRQKQGWNPLLPDVADCFLKENRFIVPVPLEQVQFFMQCFMWNNCFYENGLFKNTSRRQLKSFLV